MLNAAVTDKINLSDFDRRPNYGQNIRAEHFQNDLDCGVVVSIF